MPKRNMKVGSSVKKTWIRNIGLAALLVSIFSFAGHQALTTKALESTPQSKVPVILVHGYNNKAGNCQGIALATYWKKAKAELINRAAIPVNDVVPISYYRCDTHGIDITGYGPGKTYPFTETTGTLKPRAGHTNNSSITLVAKDLAWFIHNEYTAKGRSVNVAGHSMGGLITREMLRRVQAQDPDFPSTIDVRRALTISTPHNGWGEDCNENVQCREMSDGSPFLATIQTNAAPQGVSGTSWWAMAMAGVGGDAKYLTATCDVIPTDSAIAVGGTDLVYTKPCYKHNAYLNDDSQVLDAQGSDVLAGRHSLRMLVDIMK
jgi:pimeloyl-ACP methyl ester carboxylesterase